MISLVLHYLCWRNIRKYVICLLSRSLFVYLTEKKILLLIDSGAERCLFLSISVNLFNIFNLEHNSTFPNFACKILCYSVFY